MLGKTRTLNPQIRSLVLYPIELQAQKKTIFFQLSIKNVAFFCLGLLGQISRILRISLNKSLKQLMNRK